MGRRGSLRREKSPNFDFAFKLFLGENGIVPLSGNSVEKLETEALPEFNPLASGAASISMSAFGPGGPFGFNSFFGKILKKKSESSRKKEHKGDSSKHEALGNEWLEKGNCPIAKSYRAVSHVIPIVAASLRPPPGIKLKCPAAIVAARAALGRTSFVKTMRQQPLPSKGGIHENEDPRNAAIRELREETGVTSADIVDSAPYWLTYDFPPKVREKLNEQWGSNWKGQAQKWFLFKFNGNDEEVNLLGDGTEKPEFGQWSWLSPQEVVNHAVDFKKPVYNEVLKFFSPYIE